MTAGNQRYFQPDWAEPDLLLMADDRLIDAHEGATFSICPMQKASQPVLEPTETWEGGDGKNIRPVHQDPLDGSVVYDKEQQRFMLWYHTHNRLVMPGNDPATGKLQKSRLQSPMGSPQCVAYSKDGLSWEKPSLGCLDTAEGLASNMINASPAPLNTIAFGTVLPDPRPDAPAPLVASAFSHFTDPVYPQGITILQSQAGLHWQPHFPPVLPIDGDAHALMWDSRRQCFICTTRSAQHTNIIRRLNATGRTNLRNKRHVALASSRDLIHWTPMLDILEADDRDPADAQIYMMYILPYGHAYLGFAQMFYMSDDMTWGPLEMQLAISRDLKEWWRVGDRTPILPRGKAGSWDQSHVVLTTNPPFADVNQLRFWYGGKDTEHWQAGRTRLSTATLRRDGFACWRAGTAGGQITTHPMQLNWATWPMLNVDATNGSVRLEILGENGQPMPGCSAQDCRPITGDHLRAVVDFGQSRGTFLRHTGKVRLRFHLQNAALYAVKAPNLALPETC